MKLMELRKLVDSGEDSRHQFKSDIANLDSLAAEKEMPDTPVGMQKLLENMNLAQGSQLNLAGLMLFGEKPNTVLPAFIIKAMAFPGHTMATDKYLDSEDIEGPLTEQYSRAMGFILRHLRKLQGSKSVNSTGEPEVPRMVFEELMVNALIHRDYFISAPVRLLIFSDRIEIISPGHLPNHLTVEKILAGNTNIRNPILVSYISKGLLPYRGLGSGIQRVLAEWPGVRFKDDRDACLFTAVIQREPQNAPVNAPVNAPANAPVRLNGTQQEIMRLMREDTHTTLDAIAVKTTKDRTTIRRNIAALKRSGLLKRIGSDKVGYWQITE